MAVSPGIKPGETLRIKATVKITGASSIFLAYYIAMPPVTRITAPKM